MFDGLSSLLSEELKGLSPTLINLLVFAASLKVKTRGGESGGGGKGEVECSTGV